MLPQTKNASTSFDFGIFRYKTFEIRYYINFGQSLKKNDEKFAIYLSKTKQNKYVVLIRAIMHRLEYGVYDSTTPSRLDYFFTIKLFVLSTAMSSNSFNIMLDKYFTWVVLTPTVNLIERLVFRIRYLGRIRYSFCLFSKCIVHELELQVILVTF